MAATVTGKNHVFPDPITRTMKWSREEGGGVLLRDDYTAPNF